MKQAFEITDITDIDKLYGRAKRNPAYSAGLLFYQGMSIILGFIISPA